MFDERAIDDVTCRTDAPFMGAGVSRERRGGPEGSVVVSDARIAATP